MNVNVSFRHMVILILVLEHVDCTWWNSFTQLKNINLLHKFRNAIGRNRTVGARQCIYNYWLRARYVS